MILSKTSLPLILPPSPYSYYTDNLGICNTISIYRDIIFLNNQLYQILTYNEPEQKAIEFAANLIYKAPTLPASILINYYREFDKLPEAVKLPAIQLTLDRVTRIVTTNPNSILTPLDDFVPFNETEDGGDTPAPQLGTAPQPGIAPSPPPGGGGGGTCNFLSGGTDRLAYYARTVEHKRYRAHGVRFSPDGYAPGYNEFLSSIEPTSQDEFFKERPYNLTWIPEYTWNKLANWAKKKAIKMAMIGDYVDYNSNEQAITPVRRRLEIAEEQNIKETLANRNHNLPGLERTISPYNAAEMAKPNILQNSKNNRGDVCFKIDYFNFSHSPHDPKERINDKPAPLFTDSNKDTHGEGFGSIVTRLGKYVHPVEQRTTDLYSIAALPRLKEKKECEVDREDDNKEGCIGGHAGTKNNKNNKSAGKDEIKTLN